MSSGFAHTLPLVLLAGMLAAATVSDVRRHRIPNGLVLAGMAAGLALSMLPGGIGIARAAGGSLAGLLLLMPLYLMRAMGAGDVKLMAAVGAIAGWPAILVIVLYAFIAGGVLALAAAIATRNVRGVIGNVRTGVYLSVARIAAFRLPRASEIPISKQRVPYAVAIAAGAAAHVFTNGLA